MITLAIDTSETRGSVAVLRDSASLSTHQHVDQSDYSAWLLPAVEQSLTKARTKIEQIQLFAVCTGPGSFTGLRVGLTTVKAWAEVYGKQVVGVSRLEALARSAEATTLFVASCYDAQRAQLFGGLYRRKEHQLERIGDEVVTSPDDFAAIVDREANSDRVTWVSLDPELIQNLELVQRRTAAGDLVLPGSVELASTIGKIAAERAAKGEFSDSLNLDANYVRRSDAEIFWKGPAARVR